MGKVSKIEGKSGISAEVHILDGMKKVDTISIPMSSTFVNGLSFEGLKLPIDTKHKEVVKVRQEFIEFKNQLKKYV